MHQDQFIVKKSLNNEVHVYQITPILQNFNPLIYIPNKSIKVFIIVSIDWTKGTFV